MRAALFLLRDEVGGLHGVHQQFQFRQLQQPGADEVAVLHISDADDIHAEVHEQLNVAVDVLPIAVDAMCLPKLQNIRHRYIVGFIRLLKEKFR